MAKAVKSAVKVFVVTFTIGMALTILPFLSLTPIAIAEFAALSAIGTLVGGLLSKGIDATSENFGTKVATKTATAPRQIIYGQARVGGTITHIETSGTDSHKLSMIVTLAGHELESLDEVLINDISVTSTSVGLFQYATNQKFINSDNDNAFSGGYLLRYRFLDGSQTTADSSVTANTSLTTSDKFIDVAYVFIEMVFDSEAFGGGIPPMSFVVKGKKVFDPRDSNQTFGTESTYTWSDNPALCVLDYITNTTYGLKATADEINTSTALGSFKVAANTCEFDGNTITTATVNGAVSGTQVTLDISNSITLIDVGQLVTGTGIVGTVKVASRDGNVIKLSSAQTIADGTTLTIKEKSYTANGITNMSADGGGVIEGLLSSCAGKLSYIDGKFVMFAGATVTPDMTITDDNLLAPITVQTRQTSGETFNQVKSVYIDANNNYVATDSPLETTINPATSNTFLSEDTPTGEAQTNYKKSLEIQLPFTDTTTMAQRLQRTALLHTRQKTALSVVCNIAYMQLQPFDWVYLTNERLGYTNKVFEVLSTNLEILDKDGVQVLATRLDLKEINNSVYTFASSSYTNPLDEGSSVSTGSFSVSPPTSLAVATTLEITGYDLNVSWTNNPDDLVQGTEVFYGTSSGTYIGSFIVGKGTAKESINGVKASTTYYIAVRHFSANNVFSALTSEVTVTTGTAPISYSTGGGNVGTSDTLNILGANLVLNDFNSTTGGDDSANYTFLNSGNGALGGVTSYQNSDTERIQFEFGEDPDGDWGKDFFTFDFDWGLAKGGADGNSMGVGKFHIKGRAADNGDGNSWLENTIATFEVKNADGNVTTPFVTLANTTITGSTTTPIVVVSQGSAPSTTTNRLYNVGGSLYWNGAVVDTGAGDITGVTINTSSGSLTGGASFSSGDATFTLDIGGTIRGSKSFEDDVVIEGNLDVQGTTTTIDTTNLDVKDKNITLNYGSGDTSANANGAGITIQDAVSVGNDATILWKTSGDRFEFSHSVQVPDSQRLRVGSGGDLQIYHDGTNNYVEAQTGNLIIRNSNDDADINFQSDDGSGSIATYFQLDGSQVQNKFLKDTVFLDSVKAKFGTAGDLEIYHNGTHSYIDDAGTGNLYIRASQSIALQKADGTEDYLTANNNGAVTLYHNNSPKLATTSTGIDITGSITTDGMTSSQNITVNSASGSVDARLAFNNSVKNAWIGIPSWDNDSLRIYGTSPTTGNTNEPAAMYRDGAWSFWTDYSNTSGNGSTSTALFISTGGSLNVGRGDIQINGTTVIDSSRNLSNIASYNGYTPTKSSSSTNSVISLDSRNVNSSPSARNKGLYVDFKLQTTIGLTGSGNYAGVLTFRSYGSGTDLSGGYPIQIAYDQAGNLQTRYGSSSSAWGSWKAIHLAGNDLSAGNITVTGTVDGRDIATDGTKLDGIEAGATTDQTQAEINALGITAIGLSGTPDITVGTINSGAIDVTGTVTADGVSVDGNINLGDNDSIYLGDSNDLRIYHDSGSSLIRNSTGDLYIQDDNGNIYIRPKSGQDGLIAVADGAVTLHHSGNAKLATTSSGVQITGTLDVDVISNASGVVHLNDTLYFQDNSKAVFGDSSDLQIYHSGTSSFITENGTGDLRLSANNLLLRSDDTYVQSEDGTVNSARFNSTTGVTLFRAGDTKLTTTSTGIDVTGTVTSDGLTVEQASSPTITINDTDSVLPLTIKQDGANASMLLGSAGVLTLGVTNNSGSDTVILQTQSKSRLNIASNGDISFYEDTGTTAKLTWEASAEQLNIGDQHISQASITSGDSTTAGLIRASYSDGSYTDLKGYGLEFSRATSYIRPNAHNSKTLYFGGIGNSLNWASVRFTAVGGLYMTGTQFLTEARNLVNIGTINSGVITSTGLTVNGNTASQTYRSSRTDGDVYIQAQTNSDFVKIGTQTKINALLVDGSGDISFYEDTGTTVKFFWDASAERLGLGTTSPSTTLELSNASTAPILRLSNENNVITAGADLGVIEFYSGDDSGGGDAVKASISAIQPTTSPVSGELVFKTSLSTGSLTTAMTIDSSQNIGIAGATTIDDGNLQIGDSDADFNIAVAGARSKFGYDSSNNSTVVQGGITKGIIFCVNNSTFGSGEVGRFDTSGNLLVGKISSSGNTVGAELRSNGGIFGTKDGAYVARFNRLTDDGSIVEFQQDGSTKGSISVASNDLNINGGANHSGIRFQATGLYPLYNGNSANGTIDLGATGQKFQNLYLSGTINSGDITVNTTSSGNQITLQAPTPSIEFIDSQATSRKAKISAENGNLLFEADTNTGEANTAITFKMDGANA